MIPSPEFTLTIPGMLTEGVRRHNKLVRTALRACLTYHHQVRIPRHFTRPAAAMYGHRRRTERYMRYKARKFHSTTDLVKTGRTRANMITLGQKVIRGAAAAGTIEGRLTMRFPFRGGSTLRFRTRDGKSHQQVNLEQMAKEIRNITLGEVAEITRQLGDTYLHAVDSEAWTPQRIVIK